MGTTITINVGSGGDGGLGYIPTGNGYSGDDGFIRLTYNGTDYDFTSSGTHTVS